MTPAETVAEHVQGRGGGTLSFARGGVGWGGYPLSGFGEGVGRADIPLLWFNILKTFKPAACGKVLYKMKRWE